MISVLQLGQIDYGEGLRLQQKLVDLRKAGQIGDVLLLLEHTPVITLGRNARAANVLLSTEQLAARGIEVFECDRGGDVTFHGRGQIVGYPIFDLRTFSREPDVSDRHFDGGRMSSNPAPSPQPLHCHPERSRSIREADRPAESKDHDLSSDPKLVGSPQKIASLPRERKTLGAVDYVRCLEEILIRTCVDFGIATKRVADLTGVWTIPDNLDTSVGTGAPARPSGAEPRYHTTAEAKIAAIGVHISRSVTSHGFALNVNTDLSYFNLIVPCGITAKPVTSMKKELGGEVDLDEVAHSISRNFGDVFGRQMLWAETLDALLGRTVGVPMQVPAELRALRGQDDLFLA